MNDKRQTFRLRTTVADRENCETAYEIGDAVLELREHYVSSPWYSGGHVLIRVDVEGEDNLPNLSKWDPDSELADDLVERMAVAVLGELDISHASAATEAFLRERIRGVLAGGK